MRLTDSVTEIKGIGEKTAKLMEKVNIRTVGDLILSYPRDYDRYEPPADVGTIKTPGIYAVAAVIPGRPEVKLTARVKVITANLKDDSGILRAVWFNMPYLANVLKPGGRYIFRGRVVRNRYGLVMEQPAVLGFDEYDRLLHTRQPVYNLTAGLTNKTMRKAVYSALEALPVQKDYLPEWIRKKEELSEYNYAVRTIHFPKNEEELLFARK